MTVHKSYEYYTYAEDTDERLEYVFNDDGTVASVTARATVVKIKHEYDIVVGNELFEPGVPEAGYRYEIKNRKDTEIWIAVRIRPSIRLPTANLLYN